MSEKSPSVSFQPTEGLTYDPSDGKYWDPRMLGLEINRVFEVCNSCRMCFKFCDTFPSLFSLVDDTHGGEVSKLTSAETDRVLGQCFQCKLCEVQCPYTPRDGHEFQLDFPKMVHRWSAQKARAHGISRQDKLLGDPDATAKLARASFGMANVMNRVKVHRIFLEKIAGIHRDYKTPDFAQETFESWAVKNGKVKGKQPGGKPAEAVLFQTCFVQNNAPELGKDTLFVLEKNQVNVTCEKGFACCGMPAWEHGDLDTLRANAARNLELLSPYVEAGAKVVAINPTCSMMLKREYPELVPPTEREKAKRVAEAVRNPGDLLWDIRNEPRFCKDFKSTPGESVAYHAPCHLRAQAVGFKGRDLLRKIPGTTMRLVAECCGHDGTFGMRKDGYEASKRIGAKSFDQMKSADAEVWATDCPLAANQFEQHAGKKALHPMTILARAYREDGFATKLPPAPEPVPAPMPEVDAAKAEPPSDPKEASK